ncbi:MAG TPA: ABC transporter permease [Bacteroidales bacterium]|nr:ABC transporter permease [Bacteroidales bacterium]
MKHYIRFALRNLARQKTGSVINITGLSVSLAVCFIIMLYVKTEFNYDKYNKNYSNIYRLMSMYEKGSTPIQSIVFYDILKSKLPELNNSAMANYIGIKDISIKSENKDYLVDDMIFADQGFLNMFTINLIEGDSKRALEEPDKAIISESTAKKIFGDEDPLGKSVRCENSYDLVVSGVYKDLPVESSLHAGVIASIESQKKKELYQTTSWNVTSTHFFFLLPADADLTAISRKIEDVYRQSRPDYKEDFSFGLQPLSKMHLYSAFTSWDMIDKGDIREVKVFIAIAVLILFIACFNYINLSTALSCKRIMYTGVQKVMGADKKTIFTSAFTEITLIVLVCSLLALFIASFSLAGFNRIMGSKIGLDNITPGILFIYAGLMIFTIIISSFYQSWNMSKITPVAVLKGVSDKIIFGRKMSFSRFSQFLSVFQMTTTIILVVAVLTINRQMTLLTEKKLGFDKDQLVVIRNPYDEKQKERFSLLKDKLESMPEVKSVTEALNTPGQNINNNGGVVLPAKDKESKMFFGQIAVDADYLGTINAKFISGRNFDPKLSSDSNKVIINETGMKMLGLTDPIGQKVKNFTMGDDICEIIGVVEDIQYEPLRFSQKPAIFFLAEYGMPNVVVKLAQGNMQTTISKLEEIWKNIDLGNPFRYSFVDETIQANYKNEIRTKSLLTILTVLAIFISMLGIFGLGVFNTQKRTKEIGIRKINGASVYEALMMLNGSFVKWSLFGFVIAVPVSWYAMHLWLQGFSTKIALSWWIFAIAGLLTVALAIISVSWQCWRAATRNPVEALRYE